MASPVQVFQPDSDSRYLIYAEGLFGRTTSKTANMLLRYIPERIACVVDSRCRGKSVREVISTLPSDIPVVADLDVGMQYEPTHLVIGVAPTGGQLPEQWREPLLHAISLGLHLVSGLHTFLSEDDEFESLAGQHGVDLIDLRKPPVITEISQGLWRERTVPVVLTVGPDSAVGKLTAAWEFKRQLEKRGYTVGVATTGQTGILLNGEGIVVDAVRGDFISAATELLIESQLLRKPDVVLVEGQGSIYHEAFSAVTMGLLHGAMPDALLFSHRPSKRANIYGFTFPPYRQMINDYEALIEWFKPTRTLGIQIDTSEYEEKIAHSLCDEIENITGLPTADLVRDGNSPAIEQMIHSLRLNK